MSEPGPSSSPIADRSDAQRGSVSSEVAADRPSETTEPQSKRARRGDPDASSRSKRMFGLLNSTLVKAKEDNARRSSGEAARKRAELEARLQEKRKGLDDRIDQTKQLTEQLRPLVRRLCALAVELEADDAAVRLRKAQKRRLASFLITESDLSMYDGDRAKRQSVDGRVIAPEITLTLEPIGPRHPDTMKRPDSHPVYYLPRQMLSYQDDRMDEQEDKVDAEIDKVAEAWEAERDKKLEGLANLKKDIAVIREKMSILERVEKG